ncbi:transposase [Streptomyces sp. NPDC017943]|uniref:transposase n=1 Tax=Streptomyces sp. NPDC017943 TaxID=3365019 RepID=UPI0037A416F2
MIEETRAWSIEVPLVVADGGYGGAAAFRLGLEKRGLEYVVGISSTTTAQPEEARRRIPPYGGRELGPQPVHHELAKAAKKLVIEAGKQASNTCSGREAPARAAAAAV